MEGPTPVSALIHAATMVTAGVYLIARFWPVFELAPTAADIAAFVGLATLLIAATIALVVTDLKRIIAYSTMSQIGYMVVGVGIGAYSAGLFHLMTHAFFKALLFMAAGSVIAAMANRQNIDLMSGFRRALPFTSALLIVGALALAAFPLTSGFFSKDEILVFAADRGGFYWIFVIGGYLGALLTAFYSFRIGFRVVWGEPCNEARAGAGHLVHAEPRTPRPESARTPTSASRAEHHIAERAIPMRIAMAILGFGALFAGFSRSRASPTWSRASSRGPSRGPGTRGSTPPTAPNTGARDRWGSFDRGDRDRVPGLRRASGDHRRPGRRYRWLHDFLERKWYFDEAIDGLIVRPSLAVGRWANSTFERYVIQGLVAGATGAARGANAGVRGAQSGYLRSYALLLVTGFAELGLYFLLQS